jgi:hypothetical protein
VARLAASEDYLATKCPTTDFMFGYAVVQSILPWKEG